MARSTSFLRVRFTEPREFVDELRTDVALIERGVVRLTQQARPTYNGAVVRVSVVAGAIVDGRPVILDRYIGELWGMPDADEGVNRNAAQAVTWLEGQLRELGLQARAGVLEENDA